MTGRGGREGLGPRHFGGDRLLGGGTRLLGGGGTQTIHLRADFFQFGVSPLLGVGLDGRHFRFEPRVRFLARALGLFPQRGLGFGADPCRFGLEGARGLLLGGGTELLDLTLAKRRAFALLLFERDPDGLRFLANQTQLLLEASLASARTRATSASSACAAALRASSAAVSRIALVSRCDFSLIWRSCSPDAFELLVQARVGLGPDACDLALEGARRGLFRFLAGFLLGGAAEYFDFPLRLLVGETRVGGFLAKTFELGQEAGFSLGMDTGDFGLERARGFLVGRSSRFLRFGVAARVAVVPHLLIVSRPFGFFAHTNELGVEACIGLGSDPLDFGFELVRGLLLRGHPGFLRGQFAQGLGFHLRLRLRQPRFGGFLPQSLELAVKAGFGLLADAIDLALERARRGFVRGLAGFLRGGVTRLLGVALRLLLCAAGLVGFFADAFELRAEARVGIGSHARDFDLERPRGGFLRGALGLERGRFAQRLRFELALFLCLRGFATKALELGLQLGVGFPARALDFGFEQLRGRVFGGALGLFRGLVARRLRVALCLFLRALGLFGFFADPLQLRLETAVRLGSHARDFGVNRRRCRLLCGLPCLFRRRIARLLRLELRLLLRHARGMRFPGEGVRSLP